MASRKQSLNFTFTTTNFTLNLNIKDGRKPYIVKNERKKKKKISPVRNDVQRREFMQRELEA